jgi:hypothetical protein
MKRSTTIDGRSLLSRRLLVATFALAAVLAAASPAYGYYTESTTTVISDCAVCHGADDPSTDRSGPHGGYATTTNKCAACHTVHTAPFGGIKLLPGPTIKATCETCHDGTSGRGVYGVIRSRLGTATPVYGHSCESTNVVPGGDPLTGAETTATFSGTGGALTCSDCHSPHGNSAGTVAPFVGDRKRGSVETTITSNRLLKKMPTSATSTVDVYGSDWCGACHKGRLSGSGVTGNHPVDSRATTTSPFYYNWVARVSGVNTSTVTTGTLGANNFGYVMPDFGPPTHRAPLQRGHAPICQQCHEDARNVGDTGQWIAPAELFSITATDGAVVADNPRFQVFPHESQNRGLLIEDVAVSIDDLCLNCHSY